MCLYIDKVIEDLNTLKSLTKESFKDSDAKIEKPTIEDEKKKARNIILIDKFTQIGQNIYVNLNYSAISGSYVQNENFEQKIVECCKLVNDIREIIPESESVSDQIHGLFCELFLNSFKHYRFLVHSFHVLINTPDKLFLLSDAEDEENNKKQNNFNSSSDLYPYYDIFHINILIAYWDKNFSLSTNILRNLLDALYRLKKHKCNNEIYCKILVDKCTLLISKFKLKYDNEEIFKSLLISHNFTDEQFNPKTLKTEYLNSFQEIVFHVYGQDNEENLKFYREYFQKNKNKEILDFTDYFIFIRYYSKFEKNYKDIDKLIKDYITQFGANFESKFDEFSYNISINYLYNNKLSFLTKRHDISIKDVDKQFDEIQQIQARTNIKNYFPFYKIASFYNQFIEQNIENDQCKKDVTSAIRKLKEAIQMIEDNLEWTDTFDILPFQPNYDSCCVNPKIEEKKFKIFIASAYVIPINYSYYKKELKKLQENLQFFKSVEKMNVFLLKVEEAHQEVRESQKNNIQILSVFAALVIFAVGNMQAFKTVETLKEAIIFMLILAYSLCLFAIVIWFIVSYKKVKMTLAHYTLIVTLALGLCLCCFVIFSNWGNSPIVSLQSDKDITSVNIIDTTQQIPLNPQIKVIP